MVQLARNGTGNTLVMPISYAETVTVAKGGGQYTDPYEAVQRANAAATALLPYVVRIYPGIYDVRPFTVGANVTVIGDGDWTSVTLRTTDNVAHFITVQSGGALCRVTVQGPTGALKAAVHCNDTTAGSALLEKLIFTDGYYDVLCDAPHPGNFIQAQNLVSNHLGTAPESFLRIENHSGINAQLCSAVYLTDATACYYCSGAASSMTLESCSLGTYGDTQGVYANDGATVRLVSVSLRNNKLVAGGNAIHTAGTGVTTSLMASGCVIRGLWTWDLLRDTTTTAFGYRGSGRKANIDWGASTTNFSANVTVSDSVTGDSGVLNLGETWVGDNELPLVNYTTARRSTGVDTSPTVVIAGLNVTVGSFNGYAENATGDITRVQFVSDTIALDASTPYVYVYVTSAGVLSKATSLPDATKNIILLALATDAADVVLCSDISVPLAQPDWSLDQYNTEVIGVINVSGGVVSQATMPGLDLDISGAKFYTHYGPINSDASVPAQWRGWYHNALGDWEQTALTGTIDNAQYDTGAGLAALVGAARHVVYVAHGPAGTTFHLVYSDTDFADAAAAIAGANPAPPPVLQYDACRLCAVIVPSAGNINSLIDQRPRLLTMAATSGGGVVSHSDLAEPGMATGNDHTQYQLRSEQGAAGGYPNLDASAQVPIAQLPTATASPSNVDAGAADPGGATGLVAFEDHKHAVDGTAVTSVLDIATDALKGLSPALAAYEVPMGPAAPGDVAPFATGSTGRSALAAATSAVFTALSDTATNALKGLLPALAANEIPIGPAAPGDVTTFATGTTGRSALAAGTSAVLTALLDEVTNLVKGLVPAVGASGTVFTSNGAAGVWSVPVPGNYQSAADNARTTNATTSFANGQKLTLTTPALTGTYRVSWSAVVDHSATNSNMEVQLYNVTDAAIVGVVRIFRPNNAAERISQCGFAEIVFTGAAKSVQIQFRAATTGTAGCADARICIERVG